jgi:membrane protease YdiL (CAAX protease family)
MNQEEQPLATHLAANEQAAGPVTGPMHPSSVEPPETRFLKWIMFGSTGLRCGWPATLFVILTTTFMVALGSASSAIVHGVLHIVTGQFSPAFAIIGETVSVLAILAAGAIAARVDGRRLRSYYLSGPHKMRHFLSGAAGGFVALSALVGVLYKADFLGLASTSLAGAQILEFGILWAIVFLFTGFFEEGSFRCYLLYTLARGMNFWWSAGCVAALTLLALVNPGSNGAGGVYLMAGLGVVPCLLLQLKGAPSSGFWQAAWFTSTGFGYVHTFNQGETWIGIFAAAAIGFVFCVSIRLTGSVWWAIGFHGAWDWAQTFIYGTPDSGFASDGHFLTAHPIGSAFWSGGADGPEGSVLVIPIVLLTLFALLVVYGRKRRALESSSATVQPQLS